MTTIQKTKQIHISLLRHGDTIVLDDGAETVNGKNIKNGFTGYTYKGDPFYKTKGMIDVALFPKWSQGKVVGWYTQI